MSRHAYSDGSEEDKQYYTEKAMERRKQMSAVQAVDKLLEYMEQQIEVLEVDKKRFKKIGDKENYLLAAERIAWVEGMIFFVNNNI